MHHQGTHPNTGSLAPFLGAVVLVCFLIWRVNRGKQKAGDGPKQPTGELHLWVNQKDSITVNQLYEGCLITGSTGSGKSSGPGASVARLLLLQGCGIVVLAAKRTDATDWWNWCAQTGRAYDYLRLGVDMPWRFDWLNEELHSPGGTVGTATSLLQVLVETVSRSGGNQDEPYWQLSSTRHLYHCLLACYRAWGRCSCKMLYDFLISTPGTEGEMNSAAWNEGFCAQTFGRLVDVFPRGDKDRELVLGYFRGWMSLADKPQSIISSMALNVVFPFVTGPLAELVREPDSEHPSLTPLHALKGKVVVVDYPTLVYRDPAKLFQVVFKVLTQRACLRRTRHDVPVALFCDEGHLLALPQIDAETQAVCRSHKLVQVNIVQNLPILFTSLGGGDKGRQEAEAWIANLQTKIICQNNCKETNQYVSDLIGMRKELFISGSQSTRPYDMLGDYLGTEEAGGSASFGEQLAPEVLPREINALAKGGLNNNLIVEAIVLQGGRRFSNGKQYTRGYFPQGPRQ